MGFYFLNELLFSSLTFNIGKNIVVVFNYLRMKYGNTFEEYIGEGIQICK